MTTAWAIILQLATSDLTPTETMRCFSFHVNIHIPWLWEKYWHRSSRENNQEIAETTKIWLRTVQHITKNWKDSGDPSSSSSAVIKTFGEIKSKENNCRTQGYV